MHIPSYSSIFNLGHKAISDLLKREVLVQEKVDGSQFSFMRVNDEVYFRSKGADIITDAPPKLFSEGVREVLERKAYLENSFIYRGEFLSKPKHNALSYDRIPKGHVAIFDIEAGPGGNFLPYEEVRQEAWHLELDVVPLLFKGIIPSQDALLQMLETTSFLGGQKIEGVVVKPLLYDLWGEDKKVLMGKFVSEAFKEVHGGEWRKNNPTRGDIIQQIILKYKTPARWNKAIQHFRDDGTLTDSPKDIGPLLKEIWRDVQKEEEGEIKEMLFKNAWEHIQRGITAGFPQWYKEELLKKGFEG